MIVSSIFRPLLHCGVETIVMGYEYRLYFLKIDPCIKRDNWMFLSRITERMVTKKKSSDLCVIVEHTKNYLAIEDNEVVHIKVILSCICYHYTRISVS